MDKDYYKQYEPIFGSWRITRLIGQGSFGRVYEIQREDFGVTYKAALKAITVPTSQAEVQEIMAEGMDEGSVRTYFGSFVKELVQEFALMSKLKGNSNVVSYENHQVIEHKDTIGWDILIQMELLTPLNDYIKEHKNISRQEVIRLGIDLCKALELCQKHNIIHRDIKPENIFVSDNGDFKLGDFGIARTVEKTSSGLSKKGTYNYMAPEVYKGEAYGSTVDIYSLGIVLYRLLNGNRNPFYPVAPAPITYADRENALLKRISGAPLPFPSHADGRLAEIVLKACEFDPKQRYSSPVQMRQELEAILYNRAEGQIIYPEGDEITQGSVGYIEKDDTPIGERELTLKDDGEQEKIDDTEKTVSDLDKTISDLGETVSELEETISDLNENGGGFGTIPIPGSSGDDTSENDKKVAAKKKMPLKEILIWLGAVAALTCPISPFCLPNVTFVRVLIGFVVVIIAMILYNHIKSRKNYPERDDTPETSKEGGSKEKKPLKEILIGFAVILVLVYSFRTLGGYMTIVGVLLIDTIIASVVIIATIIYKRITQKKSLKGIFIGLGAVAAVIFGVLFYALFIEEGTPVLYSAMADYGEPFAYSDLYGRTRGYYTEVLGVVVEEMGYHTYLNILPPEELNSAVLQGNEDAPILADDCIVGVSFAEPMSSEVAQSVPFSTDKFVFLTTQENSVARLPNLGALTENKYSIGVVAGTMESGIAECGAGLYNRKNTIVYDSASDAVFAVLKKEIDCLFLHEQTAKKIMNLNPEFVLCDVELIYSHTLKVRQKDTKLLQKLNETIERTKGNSLWDIKAKYITQWGEYKEQSAYEEYKNKWIR